MKLDAEIKMMKIPPPGTPGLGRRETYNISSLGVFRGNQAC